MTAPVLSTVIFICPVVCHKVKQVLIISAAGPASCSIPEADQPCQENAMTDETLIGRYNYNELVLHKFEQWLNFEASPPLGQPAPALPV